MLEAQVTGVAGQLAMILSALQHQQTSVPVQAQQAMPFGGGWHQQNWNTDSWQEESWSSQQDVRGNIIPHRMDVEDGSSLGGEVEYPEEYLSGTGAAAEIPSQGNELPEDPNQL